jgi:cation diffusion facilitator family transporter
MHTHTLERWQHSHSYLGHAHDRNARRTQAVIGLTATMMIAEIAAGSTFGSMALLADGWHMATHVGALSITALAYALARRHAGSRAFSFGTGKFGDLAGFASALILALISLLIGYESLTRLVNPVPISFDAALGVAAIGLVVNLVSALLLQGEEHAGAHGEEPAHSHAGHGDPHHGDPHRRAHHDHNLRSAYVHVLADALTSVLAILALLSGRWLGWVWMDPAMGIVGALVIARWSYGLIRDTSRVLLDHEADAQVAEHIRQDVEAGGDDRVADLHLWRVGPGHFAAILSVVTHEPRTPEYYKAKLNHHAELSHVTVEVQTCG